MARKQVAILPQGARSSRSRKTPRKIVVEKLSGGNGETETLTTQGRIKFRHLPLARRNHTSWCRAAMAARMKCNTYSYPSLTYTNRDSEAYPCSVPHRPADLTLLHRDWSCTKRDASRQPNPRGYTGSNARAALPYRSEQHRSQAGSAISIDHPIRQ